MLAPLFALTLTLAAEPPTVRLWDGPAPRATGDSAADVPTLTLYAPKTVTGTAVVVCPGGGYGALAKDHEGKQIGEWLAARGVTAAVLTYRHAPRYADPVPMLDAQRAIRWVRAKSAEFGLDAKRVGVWGFSAGGHLASTVATHFDDGDAGAKDPVERASCRPDFAILAYPVISMEPGTTHAGSRKNLLGETPDPARVAFYNNHERVTDKTPPTFLFHTGEDTAVLPINSVLFYQACLKHRVPAEIHVYGRGGHGVGLARGLPGTDAWPAALEAWLRGRGLLGPA